MLSKFALTFALASLALGGSALAQEAGAAKAAPTVTVVGFASEDARPDIAIVTFDILDERPTASDAAGENARRSTAVIESLENAGIETKDIKTIGVNLSPVWNDERDAKTGQVVKRTLSGYQASNTLSVRLRAIDKAGSIIDALRSGRGDEAGRAPGDQRRLRAAFLSRGKRSGAHIEHGAGGDAAARRAGPHHPVGKRRSDLGAGAAVKRESAQPDAKSAPSARNLA
ncbi:MAG: SIMPL domain-containing protein [Roseiarcus sp.]